MRVLFVTPTLDNPSKSLYMKGPLSTGFSKKILNCLDRPGNDVRVLSKYPFAFRSIRDPFILGWRMRAGRVRQYQLPFVNIPFFNEILSFLTTVLFIISERSWSKSDTVIVTMNLALSSCIGCIVGGWITRTAVVAVVTDIPGIMVVTKQNLKGKLYININKAIHSRYDGLILLTKSMKDFFRQKILHIIMEGLVNGDEFLDLKKQERACPSVMYAGTLNREYGIKLLLDAISYIKGDFELWLFGSGDYQEMVQQVAKKDLRIKYLGVRPQYEILKYESMASILVNPRPSHYEYTKYSFPSKTMEYMLSGTPVISSYLPGIPEEYLNYLIIVDDETPEGFGSAIGNLLDAGYVERKKIGEKAARFILENKTSKKQGERINALLHAVVNSKVI